MQRTDNLLQELNSEHLRIQDPKIKTYIIIHSQVLKAMREYLDENGFLEMPGPILARCTDPGIRGAKKATTDYYGKEYYLISSAILHKQMLANAYGRIYIVSPNVRLESTETATTGRHLTEFYQIDVEEAEADYERAMNIAEGLVVHTIKRVKEEYGEELESLGRELEVPEQPFKRITHFEAITTLRNFGRNIDFVEIPWQEEEVISANNSHPFFIKDYPFGARGFYDKKDDDNPYPVEIGNPPTKVPILRDFDLLLPEGFGEVVSGAQREYELGRVIERLRGTEGENIELYQPYLQMLKDGIKPSAGFGIGWERMTRYITGAKYIWQVRPYPKIAGVHTL